LLTKTVATLTKATMVPVKMTVEMAVLAPLLLLQSLFKNSPSSE
jgi:hypothetical protein